MVIASELEVFGAMSIGFASVRLTQVELFASSKDSLNRLAGAINTMVLITSGFCAAVAVHFQLDAASGGWSMVFNAIILLIILVLMGLCASSSLF